MKINHRDALGVFSIALLAIATLCCVSCQTSVATSKRPNVVLIYADDLGFNDIGCNGNTMVATLNIDQIAKEGINFTNIYSSSADGTLSRLSMLTGEYAWRCEGGEDGAITLRDEQYTIADMFRSVGYATAMVGRWSFDGGVQPSSVGFDYSDTIEQQGEDAADELVERSVNFIRDNAAGQQPFFLYVATDDIRAPHYPHSRFSGKSEGGARGDATLSLDWSVGEIWSALKRYKLDQNTIIVISSDSGAAQDGAAAESHMATHVPCIVRWSGEIEPGISCAAISQVDWLRSFASLVGANLPKDVAKDSQDLWAAWSDASLSGRDFIITQEADSSLSIMHEYWKYIPSSSELSQYEPQLYNLKEDPSERENRYSRYSVRAYQLNRKLKTIVE